MANQPGLKMLLDKLKQQMQGFQQARKLSSERPQGQFNESAVDDAPDVYAGPPLEMGNELLITSEIVRLFPGLSNALGRVVLIDQLPSNGKQIINASAFGIQVAVDLILAQQMRAAYIRREEAWS